MGSLSNAKVLVTTVLVTMVGVLLALKVNERLNKARVSSPMASK